MTGQQSWNRLEKVEKCPKCPEKKTILDTLLLFNLGSKFFVRRFRPFKSHKIFQVTLILDLQCIVIVFKTFD